MSGHPTIYIPLGVALDVGLHRRRWEAWDAHGAETKEQRAALLTARAGPLWDALGRAFPVCVVLCREDLPGVQAVINAEVLWRNKRLNLQRLRPHGGEWPPGLGPLERKAACGSKASTERARRDPPAPAAAALMARPKPLETRVVPQACAGGRVCLRLRCLARHSGGGN